MGSRLKDHARKPSARPAASRASGPPAAQPSRRIAAMLSLLVTVAAVFVWRGALRYGLSQDDWFGIARSAGTLPRLDQPWRWLSAQATYDVLLPLLGMRSHAWHAWPLAAHALLSGGLTYTFVRRFGPAAGVVGALFFACHPASFDALYWFSAHSDVLAAALAFAAFLLIERTDRARWLALPVALAALLEKESVVLLPFAWLALRWRRERRVERDPLTLSVAALALVWIAYFVVAVVPARFAAGGSDATLGVAAYGTDPAELGSTLLTYAGWAAGSWLPSMRGFSDARDPAAMPWGGALLAVLVAGGWLPELRRRGWRALSATAAVLLLPVLPLTRHVYHYYLYAALLPLAALVAVAAQAGTERLKAPMRDTLAAVVSLLLVGNGIGLVEKIETMPFLLPELHAQGTVDRACIASNVLDDLGAANLPLGSSLALWSPQARMLSSSRGEDPARESYFEKNVRTALLDGLVVRLVLPSVRELRFVREFEPASAAEQWAIYRPEGRLRVMRADTLAAVLAAGPPK